MNIDKWLRTEIDNDIVPYHENYHNDKEYGTNNTNKYHAETLFRQMLDYSDANNFNYSIYNCQKEDYIDCNLLDVSLRDSFYKFCYDHSTKQNELQVPTKPTPMKKI